MASRIPRQRLANAALRPSPQHTRPLVARQFSATCASPESALPKPSLPGDGSNVPPESPSYIPLPSEPFANDTKPERVRGSLPLPRRVFDGPYDLKKAKPDYVDKAYPRPSAEKGEPTTATQEWKRLMAEARRANLRAGLKGLWSRQQKADAREAKTHRRRQEEHMAATKAPVPDHDRYTRPTLLPGTLRTRVDPDPQRFEKAEEKKLRTAQKEDEKRILRRDAILELYLNAADFIVDEQTFEKEVNRMFSKEFFNEDTGNAWTEYGNRPGLADLLTDQAQYTKHGIEHASADFARHARRQKTVTEELTGGKLDVTYDEGQ